MPIPATPVRAFTREHIDAAAIDRNADIPREVIDGLGKIGVLGIAFKQNTDDTRESPAVDLIAFLLAPPFE